MTKNYKLSGYLLFILLLVGLIFIPVKTFAEINQAKEIVGGEINTSTEVSSVSLGESEKKKNGKNSDDTEVGSEISSNDSISLEDLEDGKEESLKDKTLLTGADPETSDLGDDSNLGFYNDIQNSEMNSDNKNPVDFEIKKDETESDGVDEAIEKTNPEKTKVESVSDKIIDDEMNQENVDEQDDGQEKEDSSKNVLEKGSYLDIESLEIAPIEIGDSVKANDEVNEVEVSDFEGLKRAIENAKGKTTIVIKKSFDIGETIIIGKDKDIVITSGADRNKDNNKERPLGEDKITLPEENDSVEKSQELLEEVEDKDEKAFEDTESSENSQSNMEVSLTRKQGFLKYLFDIKKGGKLTLGSGNKNSILIIDGNLKVTKNKQSLVEVRGTLNIKDGAVLQNNIIVNDGNNTTRGGAIHASGAKVNMSGGIIRNNQANYGGGIYLNNSVMDFSGGIIRNNKAKRLYDTDVRQYYGAGGGILLYDGSTLNMSGGKIIDNYSAEIGGGISVGGNDWGATNILNMNGGTIERNTAGAAGGGIFIQAKYFSGGASKAYITAGKIINNKMDGTGVTNKAFGGGGIYVNGANNAYGVNGGNGELHLKNALITDNKAEEEGGGYAACPISKTHIYVTDGVALYDNKTNKGNAKEIYILSNHFYGLHSGNPSYEISDRMLGGNLYYWKDNDGNLVDKSKLSGKLLVNNQELILQTSEKPGFEGLGLAKVLISGNTSTTRGGGIGSNGTVYFGTNDSPLKDLQINKSWVNVSDYEEKEVKVEIRARLGDLDWLIEEVTLNKDNDFSFILKDLPATVHGKNIEDLIYVKEILRNSDEYKVEISDVFSEDNTTPNKLFSIQITNSKPEEPPKTPPEEPKEPPKTPPEEPEEPPETPPEEPEEPPEIPPENPWEPPEEPPVIPEEPPITPPEEPLVPMEITPVVERHLVEKPIKPYTNRIPGHAPKTYDPGVGLYIGLSAIALAGLGVLRKKEDDE